MSQRAPQGSTQEYDLTDGVQYTDSQPKAKGTKAAGRATEDYQFNLAVRAGVQGKYGLFSGSASAGYGTTQTSTDERWYSETFDSHSYYTLGISPLDVSVDTTDVGQSPTPFCVSRSLQAAFDQLAIDTNGKGAIDFFHQFGTHVVTGIDLGGQVRYAAFGSQSDFSSQDEFNANAEGKYDSLAGSATFTAEASSATTKKESKVTSESSVVAIGGESQARSAVGQGANDAANAAAYTTSANSVPGNYAWIDYTRSGGSLTEIWRFSNDDDKRNYLQSVFDQLHGGLFETANAAWELANQGTNQSKQAEADLKTALTWNPNNDKEVLVGWGGRINDNNHISRMVIISYNLQTDEFSVEVVGSGSDSSSWESFFLAPQGSVITGLGMAEGGNNVKYLNVWTQKLKLADQSDPSQFLDSTITRWTGATPPSSKKVDPLNLSDQKSWALSGSDTKLGDLELYFEPDADNQKVIRGITVESTKRNKGFDYLNLYRADVTVNHEPSPRATEEKEKA